MEEGRCGLCGCHLSRYNPGELCSLCRGKLRSIASAELDYAKRGYFDVQSLAELLHMHPESVRRILRCGPSHYPRYWKEKGISARKRGGSKKAQWAIQLDTFKIEQLEVASYEEIAELLRLINQSAGWLPTDTFDSLLKGIAKDMPGIFSKSSMDQVIETMHGLSYPFLYRPIVRQAIESLKAAQHQAEIKRLLSGSHLAGLDRALRIVAFLFQQWRERVS